MQLTQIFYRYSLFSFLLQLSTEENKLRDPFFISGKNDLYLKVDFEDTYTSLPLKNLAVWSWFTDYCYEADFILKLDDDVLINPFKLMDLFKQMTEGNE